MKVDIKNFGLIRSGTIEFKPGLTVIRGQSGNGKSTIIRAIETAIFNKPGDRYVTAGERSSAVRIVDGSKKVIWKKDLSAESKTLYQVGEKLYTKVGRGVFQEAARELGIEEVRLSNDRVRVNFSKQLSYPFLLDKTPPQLYEFFSLSKDSESLSAVIQEMRVDLDRYKVDLRVLEGVIDSTKEQIKYHKKIVEKAGNYKETYDAIIALDPQVKRLEKLQGAVARSLEIHKAYTQLVGEYKKVKAVEDSGLLELFLSESEAFERMDYAVSLAYFKYKQVLALREENQKYESLLGNIDTAKAEELIKNLNKIVQSVDECESSARRIQNLIEERDQVEAEIRDLEDELKEFKVCPLCEQEIK